MAQSKNQRIKIKKTVSKLKKLIYKMNPKKQNALKAFFWVCVIWLLFFALFAALPNSMIEQNNKLASDDSRIATDDKLLQEYIKDYGADKAIMFIKTLPVDCHQRVHKVGRFSYELIGDKAFEVINSECMSGYTHGVTEAYFHEHGTENINTSLELICQGEQNGFYAHQCFHGVGHGLMAYNDYDLPEALKSCDFLPSNGTAKESCYTGVFMENVVGAVPEQEAKNSPDASQYHVTSWLSDDPLFPCNAVDDIYKNGCYIFQTSRMIRVFDNDYKKVAAECASIELIYRSTCFFSMGRDVSATYNNEYSQIESACNRALNKQLRQSCISGAAQDKFWHESEQDDALGMCHAMKNPASKANCYHTISARGQEIIANKEAFASFCAKFEPEYASLCVAKQ